MFPTLITGTRTRCCLNMPRAYSAERRSTTKPYSPLNGVNAMVAARFIWLQSLEAQGGGLAVSPNQYDGANAKWFGRSSQWRRGFDRKLPVRVGLFVVGDRRSQADPITLSPTRWPLLQSVPPGFALGRLPPAVHL